MGLVLEHEGVQELAGDGGDLHPEAHVDDAVVFQLAVLHEGIHQVKPQGTADGQHLDEAVPFGLQALGGVGQLVQGKQDEF